jgi:hypothetical protein
MSLKATHCQEINTGRIERAGEGAEWMAASETGKETMVNSNHRQFPSFEVAPNQGRQGQN